MYIEDIISISDVFCPIYLDNSVVDYTFLIKLSNNIFVPPFINNSFDSICGYFKEDIHFIRNKYLMNTMAAYSLWEVKNVISFESKMFSKLLPALNYICKNTNQQYLIPKFYEIDYRTYAKYYFGSYEIKHHYLLDKYGDTFNSFLI